MSGDTDQLSGVDQQQALTTAPPPEPTTKGDRERQKVAQELGKADKKLAIKLRVYSPFREYYEGYVFSLSAENATGPFDILPGHHNFISLLLPCELIISTVDVGDLKIRISGGIIHVKADQVIVFLDV